MHLSALVSHRITSGESGFLLVLQVLQFVVAALYGLVGLAALRSWVRARDAAGGFLALAVGGIAAVSLGGQLEPRLDQPFREVVQQVLEIAFLLSGYALVRLRATFVPLSRTAHRVVIGVLVATQAAGSIALLSTNWAPASVKGAISSLFILVWAACALEPAARFWWSARSLPRVQRSRLRSLAAGFTGIALILVVSSATPSFVASIEVGIAIQLIAAVLVGLMYVSFAPPAWLRRAWREPEEEDYRAAMRDLVLFSPTRAELARRSSEWATRLLGAAGAAVFTSDGTALATYRIEGSLLETVRQEAQSVNDPDHPEIRALRDRATSLVLVALPTQADRGVLAVVSGPFTPYFGTDELRRLTQYATSITAALDRASLTERLAALERTKTEFLNLASHELRGPVTLIRGYLSMLKSGTFGPVSGDFANVLPILELKADEMNSLVEQMLEAARLEEGRLELHPVDTDLNLLAEQAVQLIRPLAGSTHRVVLEKQTESVPVRVDPDRIGTILGNLLSNAIKYSPDGGEVKLIVGRSGSRATVSVQDSGVGIPDEHTGRLFTRFGRIATPDTQHIGGTGLGLYLSRELARLHGGDVVLAGRNGAGAKGSTFVLEVPVEAPDRQATELAS